MAIANLRYSVKVKKQHLYESGQFHETEYLPGTGHFCTYFALSNRLIFRITVSFLNLQSSWPTKLLLASIWARQIRASLHGLVEKLKLYQLNLKKNTTPSCVSFLNGDVFVGDAAVDQHTTNATNTIFEAKRFMGQTYDSIKDELKLLPVTLTKDTQPKYEVEVGSMNHKFLTPEEVLAFILKKLKNDAETHINQQLSRHYSFLVCALRTTFFIIFSMRHI